MQTKIIRSIISTKVLPFRAGLAFLSEKGVSKKGWLEWASFLRFSTSLIFIKKIFLSLLICLSFYISPIHCQDSLTIFEIPVDTVAKFTQKSKFSLKNYFKDDYPSPRKAITLAVIPGMGQIYNKKYWKLPLVYGALGGVIYAIRESTDQYVVFRDTYIAKTNPDSMLEDSYPNSSIVTIQSIRNSADKNRQLAWIGLIGFYLISAGDAFVDAHLKDFNIDDDISWQPSFQSTPYDSAIVGISVKININK